uniref:ARAD1B07898p n=1 Tax=Blastobotrys adeninivorans TaxID=409370 RepID=A0A060TBI0_BLAAD
MSKRKRSIDLLPLNYPSVDPSGSFDDNYEILNSIEEGTYGVVSRGVNVHTKAVVAIKAVRPDTYSRGLTITSLREISVLKQVRHQNIVNLIEVVAGPTAGKVYLVMEFVEHDLGALIRSYSQNRPLFMSEIKTILSQILSGTQALHNHWIMHRDLKTANILMTNKGIVKIADLGLARKYGDELYKYTTTVVTVTYRAPEVFFTNGDYGPEIDMWSIGCIFAELLSKDGSSLFRSHQELGVVQEIFDKIGVPTAQSWPDFRTLPNNKIVRVPKNPPEPTLLQLVPRATAQGKDLLHKLLALDPSKRITASAALNHAFFTSESPPPKHPTQFPSFPSRGKLDATPTTTSPTTAT